MKTRLVGINHVALQVDDIEESVELRETGLAD